MAAVERIDRREQGVLRFLTAGSVDDGKSTLIGRLLHDCQAILADQLASIERSSRRRGMELDLSLLTDGLSAEREQGITIDVAYRYFATPKRKFIIADAPGHEQYTRNMVTAASTAQLAILLVDARKGIVAQTKRHATIAHLIGIPHLVLAVNKMDLVDYREDAYAAIVDDFACFAAQTGITAAVHALPMAALHGDMVVERGERLRWHPGPALLHLLETVEIPPGADDASFRFPVQYVARIDDARGYMGRVESGSIQVGDPVTVLPSGRTSRIADIRVFEGGRSVARCGDNVTLLLDDAVDVARGDMLVRSGDSNVTSRNVDATLCWLSSDPLSPSRTYRLRQATREIRARIARIDSLWNVSTQAAEPAAATLAMNDIARIRLGLADPIVADSYAANRSTGCFVLIDETTNNTVAAGVLQ